MYGDLIIPSCVSAHVRACMLLSAARPSVSVFLDMRLVIRVKGIRRMSVRKASRTPKRALLRSYNRQRQLNFMNPHLLSRNCGQCALTNRRMTRMTMPEMAWADAGAAEMVFQQLSHRWPQHVFDGWHTVNSRWHVSLRGMAPDCVQTVQWDFSHHRVPRSSCVHHCW